MKRNPFPLVCIGLSIFTAAIACAQEGGTPKNDCSFNYSSSPFASLVQGSVQVTSNLQSIDFAEGTIGSHDSTSKLAVCESSDKKCVKLGGVPLFFPENPLKKKEWRYSGYHYVVGSPFSEIGRGRFSIVPIYVYQLKGNKKSSLEFSAVFFIDQNLNLVGYTFWINDAVFGNSRVKLLNSYWLVGDRAPLACLK